MDVVAVTRRDVLDMLFDEEVSHEIKTLWSLEKCGRAVIASRSPRAISCVRIKSSEAFDWIIRSIWTNTISGDEMVSKMCVRNASCS